MIKFTASQGQAIGERGADLLVSASAGSGKTTVMIERIADMIIRGQAGVDSILVLTFTNASAADMKAKLRKRLEGETKRGGEIEHQINMLPTAQIGTFHKFCGNLVRTYFNIANVNPAFEILDETEATVLRGGVLDEVVAKHYDDCAEAIDIFCANRRTDNLKQIIIDISEFLLSRSDAREWLETSACAGCGSDLQNNTAMKQIILYYNQTGSYFAEKFNRFLITARVEQITKTIPFIEHCVEVATRIARIASYNDLREIALSTNFETLRGDKNFSEHQNFKELRDSLKDIIKKIEEHFTPTEHQMISNQQNDKRIVEQIIKLVTEYMSAYSALKLQKERLDFSDLERYACKLLENAEIAQATREKYKYVFIDEYQDTNPMQEKILVSIGGAKNIFMVGDIKQSIYGFRGCEPTIFAGKMTDFDKNLSGKVVKLNENFRSNPKILEFVNCVFGKIMKDTVADIDYANTSKFALGGQYSEPKGALPTVETIVIDTKTEREKNEITVPYDIETDSGMNEELKSAAAQSVIIADRIAKFLKTQIWDAKNKSFRPVRLGDIAILARSRTHTETLLEILKNANIDASVNAEQNACELFEIALLNNMLFAVSNFYNDIPLVLLMQSFIFGFTANDLARIRLETTDKLCFFKLIQLYIQNHKDELTARLNGFLAFLDKYHDLSKWNTVTDLLTIFLTEYKVFDLLLLLPEGQQFTQNIYSYINKLRGAAYAQSTVQYLYLLENDLIEIKINCGVASADRVQIMTMHSSKGLEFPIVILFNMGAKFNKADTHGMMIIDKNCGLCVYSADGNSYIKTNSIARIGAGISKSRVMIAEEMRLLYVAMTRAKNHLLIVGACEADKLSESCDDYDIFNAKNYLHFLAPTIVRPVPECDFEYTKESIQNITVTSHDRGRRVLAGKHDEAMANELKQLFGTEYPHSLATSALLKNSVTSLTKREEDFADFKPHVLSRRDRGTEYGTAFHKAMQKADFGSTDHADKNIQKCIETIMPILEGMKIYRELTFLQTHNQDGESVLVQGVIDLLALSTDNRAVLIDYKTTNAQIDKLVELYAPQLSMYATAVHEALGISNIEIYIYSTVHNRLIKIEPK